VSRWKEWFAFLFVGVLAWGTSFMWIKVALLEVGPLTLVLWRFLFGALSAWLIVWAMRIPIDRNRKKLAATLLLGLVNSALPITLITWAELYIDSGLTSLLNSTMPLWTIIIAHQFLHDDRFTRAKAIGLLVGFSGAVILLIRDMHPQGWSGSFWGQLAVLLAAFCYGCSNVFARRVLKGQHPLQTTAVSLTSAVLALAIVAPIIESPLAVPRLPMTWLACAWMGVIGLGLAYYAYYYLLNTWGSTRTSLVTYLLPLTAVTLGVVLLGEKPSWHVFAGGALVIIGIVLVNLSPRPKLKI